MQSEHLEAEGAERPGDVRLAPTVAARRPKRSVDPLWTSPEGHKTKRLSFLREHPAIGGGALRTRATCSRMLRPSTHFTPGEFISGDIKKAAAAIRSGYIILYNSYSILYLTLGKMIFVSDGVLCSSLSSSNADETGSSFSALSSSKSSQSSSSK